MVLACVAVYVHQRCCLGVSGLRICVEEKTYPWATLAALIAGPCVVLTWYRRTVQKWHDIKNTIASNHTAAEALANTCAKDAIVLLDGGDVGTVGGIYGLRAIADISPTYRRLAIDVLEGFIRLRGRNPSSGDNVGGAQPHEANSGVAPKRASQREDSEVPRATNLHLRQALMVLQTLIAAQPRGSEDASGVAPGSLSKVDLSGVDLSELNLSGLDFRRAKLTRANLTMCDMRKVNLAGADLASASLVSTALDGAVLDEADLTKTDCRRASLIEARLARAYLIRTNLIGANVTGADCCGAKRFGARDKGVNWPEPPKAPDPDSFPQLHGRPAICIPMRSAEPCPR